MAKIAVLALNQQSIETARRLMQVLPEAVLYGSAQRTEGADVTFEHSSPRCKLYMRLIRQLWGFVLLEF